MAKGSFFDSTIHRIYECTNKKCEAKIHLEEQVKDMWKTTCPFCEKESLQLESAQLVAPVFIDLNKPKTIGSLGEKNYQLAIKEGRDTGIKKKDKKKPWWRKNDKVNFNVLKNPNKYVETGYA
jgi:type IV secretory pathway VirD2 relaxase